MFSAGPRAGIPSGATGDSAEQLKLRKACQQFEALFLSHLLRSMRETAIQMGPNEQEAGAGLMSDLMDEHLAGAVASGGGFGLGRMLEESLTGTAVRNADPGTGRWPLPASRLTIYGNPKEPVPTDTPNGFTVHSRSIDAYAHIVDRAAKKFDLDPDLLISVISQESDGRPDAVSSRGAKGLMQLMDETALEMGVKDPFDPEENILGGARYLRHLMDRWPGDLENALAAYNAGPSAVEKYGGVPPYAETRNYVRRVLDSVQSAGGSIRRTR